MVLHVTLYFELAHNARLVDQRVCVSLCHWMDQAKLGGDGLKARERRFSPRIDPPLSTEYNVELRQQVPSD